MPQHKGAIAWNKGKSWSEETKEKMRLAHAGAIPWNKGIKTGQITWMKGKHHTLEVIEKMRQAHIGKLSWNSGKEYLQIRNEKNPKWKGDKVGYFGLHTWVIRKLGKPETCEHCGKTGLKGNKIHWANKEHTYKRNLTDWLRLCASCHKLYDLKVGNI